MDDIRPPRNFGTTPPPTNYGRTPSDQSNQQPAPAYDGGYDTYAAGNEPEHHTENNYTVPVHKKAGKGLKVTLFLFILLAVAASAFAAWEYMQVKDLQAEVEELQKENKRLGERVYSLNYDNMDLNQKLEMSNNELEAQKELNEKMLETCGSSCSTITP